MSIKWEHGPVADAFGDGEMDFTYDGRVIVTFTRADGEGHGVTMSADAFAGICQDFLAHMEYVAEEVQRADEARAPIKALLREHNITSAEQFEEMVAEAKRAQR